MDGSTRWTINRAVRGRTPRPEPQAPEDRRGGGDVAFSFELQQRLNCFRTNLCDHGFRPPVVLVTAGQSPPDNKPMMSEPPQRPISDTVAAHATAAAAVGATSFTSGSAERPALRVTAVRPPGMKRATRSTA